ncbi:hypothetical protein NLI96_g9568 [Meripilus lineatus]|uniref:Uncharacterized protein n=1 Tax=Meripilus lineatus TaxID=2056292 RepID=A0AAD5YF55_9APHY|nr:hypothetical protein NLI96_g9568 [Physisporinus lineatus]
MEFRILTESSDWQGIIGEIWRFKGAPNDRNNPILPSYWQFLQIRLPELPETPIPKLATLSWFLREEQKRDWVDHRLVSIDPTLHVFSPTTEQVVFFWHGRNPSQGVIHPDFGEPGGSPWYDERPRLPRLRVEPSVVSNPSPGHLMPRPAFSPALTSAPGQVRKPKALSIILPYHNDPSHLFVPLQPFPDTRHTQTKTFQFPSRYYPLRFSQSNPNHEPILTNDTNEAWPASELEGLWLGSYGPHGTEVLYLHSPEECRINAWKVTGDVNVPRGVITWRFHSRYQTGPECIPPAAGLDSLPESCRIFKGSAHVCGTGFIPALESWIDCIVVVFDRDDIKVYWESLRHTSRYRRYKGRDISLETVPNESDSGIRVPPVWD